MKIGVFDSGLGGLIILRSLVKAMPEYDYVYLGDTARVPYGNRSKKIVYQFLEEGVEYLFKKDCALIIVACNTASAEALRTIQQNYLPKHYPNRRVLGVIIPTVEKALEDKNIRKIGILATQSTVNSKAYERELKKINPRIEVYQQAAPLLVPLVENDAKRFAKPIIESYLGTLLKHRVDTIILGCTHYPILKKEIRASAKIKIISQDELIADKLKTYLKRHPEIERRLSKKKSLNLFVTDLTEAMRKQTKKWFGRDGLLKKIDL